MARERLTGALARWRRTTWPWANGSEQRFGDTRTCPGWPIWGRERSRVRLANSGGKSFSINGGKLVG